MLPDRTYRDAQRPAHFPHIGLAAAIAESRSARDHSQLAQTGERDDDILDDTVGEVVGSGVATQVLERQDCDRGAVVLGLSWRRNDPLSGRRPCARPVLEGDAVCADGISDVFQACGTDIRKGRLDGAVDLLEDGLGNADPTGFGDLLQTRRDIDRVAADAAALYDDVTGIDADAVLDLVLGGATTVPFAGPRLDSQCRSQRTRRCWNIRPAVRRRQTGRT